MKAAISQTRIFDRVGDKKRYFSECKEQGISRNDFARPIHDSISANMVKIIVNSMSCAGLRYSGRRKDRKTADFIVGGDFERSRDILPV